VSETNAQTKTSDQGLLAAGFFVGLTPLYYARINRSILLISAFLLVVAIIGDVQVIRAERSIILGEPLAANSGKG